MTSGPKKRHLVTVALGSNMEPEKNLKAALEQLGALMEITLISGVYQTPPWGYLPQDDFLNAVVRGHSPLAPVKLLDSLLAIEDKQGRVRKIPNGPRTLDLDLLLYEGQILNTEKLTLPHPGIPERGFVLVPLCDIAPREIHPVTGVAYEAYLSQTDTKNIKKVNVALSLPFL